MRAPSLEIGVAGGAMAGRTESGDGHVACEFEGGMLVGVLDGLGHGREAHAAACIATTTLKAAASGDLVSLFARCHEDLRASRGVVMSLAAIRFGESELSWAGVGNVEGLLVRADGSSSEFLLLKAGVVGGQIPCFEAITLAISPGDTLVLFTDGIQGAVAEWVRPELAPQEIAQRILLRHQKGTDDALVLVARYRTEDS